MGGDALARMPLSRNCVAEPAWGVDEPVAEVSEPVAEVSEPVAVIGLAGCERPMVMQAVHVVEVVELVEMAEAEHVQVVEAEMFHCCCCCCGLQVLFQMLVPWKWEAWSVGSMQNICPSCE